MKYVNILVMVVLGCPAMFVGYLWGAIKSGFDTGFFFYDRHEAAALDSKPGGAET